MVGEQRPPAGGEGENLVDVLRSLLGGLLLLVPGALLCGYLLPGATVADAGMVAAISAALLGVVAFVVLAVAGGPFTAGTSWLVMVVSIAIAIAARLSARPARP
jgi:hypothetical protein